MVQEKGPKRRKTHSHRPKETNVPNDEIVPQVSATPPNDSPSNIFPKYSILLVGLTILAIRVSIVPNPANWWLIHPQEVEPLEVAHCKVYGYGFVTTSESPSDTPLWPVYSRIFVLAYQLKEKIGFHRMPFEVARYNQAIVAALLPLCVYMFVLQSTDGNNDASLISAALTGCSSFLTLMGCHTFPQSYASPILFLSFGLSLQVLKSYQVNPQLREREEPELTMDTSIWGLFRDVFGTFQLPRLFLSALLVGVITYVQMQWCPLVLVFVTLVILCKRAEIFSISKWMALLGLWSLGFATGIFLGACDDRVSHGWWFFTVEKPPVLPPGGNLAMALFPDVTMATVLYLPVVVAAPLLTPFWNGLPLLVDHTAVQTSRVAGTTIMAAALLVALDYQVVVLLHDAVVLLNIAAGCSIALLLRILLTFSDSSSLTGNAGFIFALKALVYGEFVLYALGTKGSFPLSQDQLVSWSAVGNQSAEVNHCLGYLANQTEITGLVLDFPPEWSGGFSLLHRKVPVLAKGDKDLYFAWETVQTGCAHVRNKVSRFKLGELVLSDTRYNFVVTRQKWKFLKTFKSVYQVGTTIIFQRKRSRGTSKYLNRT